MLIPPRSDKQANGCLTRKRRYILKINTTNEEKKDNVSRKLASGQPDKTGKSPNDSNTLLA